MPWLKWTDGETKRVKIMSVEPFQKVVHWVGGRSMDCHGSLCQMCKLGDRPSVRWSVETVTDDEAMSWEMANMVWQGVKMVADNQKQLAGLILDVVRKGVGRETRYAVMLVGKEDVIAAVPAGGDAGGGSVVVGPDFDVQAWLGQRASVSAVAGEQQVDERVGRDTAGAVEYLKGLCERLDEDPRMALGIFLAGTGKAYAGVELVGQLAAFIKHQERRVEAVEETKTEAGADLDLDTLLA